MAGVAHSFIKYMKNLEGSSVSDDIRFEEAIFKLIE